jgi:hypothetical protein
MQADAFQRAEVAQRFGDVQCQQQIYRRVEIQSTSWFGCSPSQTLRVAEFRHDWIMAVTTTANGEWQRGLRQNNQTDNLYKSVQKSFFLFLQKYFA